MRKDDFEPKPISFQELVEVRRDEMQSMMPNLFTRVGDEIVRSKQIRIREVKR